MYRTNRCLKNPMTNHNNDLYVCIYIVETLLINEKTSSDFRPPIVSLNKAHFTLLENRSRQLL